MPYQKKTVLQREVGLSDKGCLLKGGRHSQKQRAAISKWKTIKHCNVTDMTQNHILSHIRAHIS